MLAAPSAEVIAQQKATLFADLNSEHEGGGFAVNAENIERYRQQFLAMPAGDGSELYTHGAFRNVANLAPDYFTFVERLELTGGEKILEIGADSCWSVAGFARRGCDCVASDINHHLIVSDVFMREHGIYFERVVADMNQLPFRGASFDVVFCSQVLHHSTDLRQTMSEIARVLKPGGRLALFSEPMYGLLFFWRRRFFGSEARKIGINERIYSLSKWLGTMKSAGMQPELYFSLHYRYRRFEKSLGIFRNRRVKRLFIRSRIYPWLILEPYRVDVVARKE